MNYTHLEVIRENMKAHHITGAEIARTVGKSAKWINDCLAGHYPYYQAAADGQAILPVYLEVYLRDRNLLPEPDNEKAMAIGYEKPCGVIHPQSNPQKLWVVGHVRNYELDVWDFMGVFDSEQGAIAVCQNEDYFIGPTMINNAITALRPWDGGYYPLRGKNG